MAFRIKYFAAVAVWLTALTSAPIAIGQEQTQENAVRFLNLFALQNQLPIGFTARFDRLDAMQRLQLAVPGTRLVGASTFDQEAPCVTDIKTSDGKTTYLHWAKSEVYFWPRSGWSEALLASDYGPSVRTMIEVRRLDQGFSDVFWPADEAQGARFFKAMQFLRDSCDPMKTTGF